MTNDYTVVRVGTDTSGRTIWMTRYMRDWWQDVVRDLGFTPTVVQGAFMTRDGGGAAASAGYHDEGGCIDVRIWDLTRAQQKKLVRVVRLHGAAAWRRDHTYAHGGMAPHCHITLGTDRPLSAGAKRSWQAYLDGRDGLAHNGPDYEWRPKPLVTIPPEEDMPYSDWPKADQKALAADVAQEVLKGLGVIDNKNPDGNVTGERTIAATMTDVEKTQDKQGQKITELIRLVKQGFGQ